MRTFEIWSEGYRCNGDRGEATLHGLSKGNDFKEACITFAKKRPGFNTYFNQESMTYWGCGLFSKEIDARENFG